ncbi:MAG: hypothetical protein CVV64_05250 [Candidatus Wallbacteria bacterium HGW-Wallbacteria-1]|jgi:glycosyltransferase involved in cell wall biosynthesis|uniref:Glycosyl transferase family 1 domain-containing protein n=1 Tax=Candidatus Wallbacteria bacterium HGW-Wallbacteria-1 TaxID=2013854 RepID=A0A2N1PS57_9BACT|nr:MAG: hypothetical protein CVV64_05250 [Candidatus Wallbacteria bacterium HGW-Wallbacteria-1]
MKSTEFGEHCKTMNPDKPLKAFKGSIVIVTTTEQPGGGEIAALNLAAAIGKISSAKVIFACPSGKVHDLALKKGLNTVELPCWKKNPIKWVYKFRQILRAQEPEIVLAESPGAVRGSFLARTLQVVTNRFSYCGKTEKPLLMFHAHGSRNLLTTLLMGALADVIVTVSSKLRRRYRHGRCPVFMVPNGSTIPIISDLNSQDIRKRARRELGLPEKEFTAGFAGRLSPAKGIISLVQAWTNHEAPGTLAIAGERLFTADTSAEEILMKFKGSHGIHHLGQLESMENFYDALDVLILPSLDEQCPLTVTEAFSRGVPVIATPVGEIPGLIGSNLRGILIPRSNALKIAMACRQIRDQEQAALGMARESLNFARQHLSGKVWATRIMTIAKSFHKK